MYARMDTYWTCEERARFLCVAKPKISESTLRYEYAKHYPSSPKIRHSTVVNGVVQSLFTTENCHRFLDVLIRRTSLRDRNITTVAQRLESMDKPLTDLAELDGAVRLAWLKSGPNGVYVPGREPITVVGLHGNFCCGYSDTESLCWMDNAINRYLSRRTIDEPKEETSDEDTDEEDDSDD